jgi:hypothetical protein
MNADVSKGLRELADFLDAHPAIELSTPTHLVYVQSRELLADMARLGGWRKVYSDDYFHLSRMFAGDVELQVFTDRATVCRKVVTGTRVEPAKPEREVEIVEWVCDEPLLAHAEGQ